MTLVELIKQRQAEMFAELEAGCDAVEDLLPTMHQQDGRTWIEQPKAAYDPTRKDHQIARQLIGGMVHVDIAGVRNGGKMRFAKGQG